MEDERDDDFQFVVPPPSSLFCSICMLLFQDPVIIRECGHSFCRNCIDKIQNHVCPLCRTKISLRKTGPNRVLDQIVKELRVYCCYRKLGCLRELHLGEKEEHETHCPYAPAKCKHADIGCRYSGVQGDMSEHLAQCPFELMKNYIAKTDETISHLQLQLESQAKQINDLKSSLLVQSKSKLEETENQQHSSLAEEKLNPIELVPPSKKHKIYREKDKWSVPNLRCQKTLIGHTRGVTSLAFCPKKNYLFSGSHDNTIRRWNLNDDAHTSQILEGHQFTVWALAFTHDEKILYSGSIDTKIMCWDIDQLKLLDSFGETGEKIYSSAIDKKYLYSSGSGKVIRVWDLSSHKNVEQMRGHNGCVWSLQIEGNTLYSASDDTTTRIWDLRKFECLRIITQNSSKVLAVSNGDHFVFGGYSDCTIKVWDSNTFDMVKILNAQSDNGHIWEVWQLSFANNLLFSGSFDHKIKVWDIETFKCIKTLEGHKSYVHAITLGKYAVFSGSGDKTIKIWSAK